MRIAWNKKNTLPFESTYGVLQGGVLSPRLFKGTGPGLNHKKIGDFILAF